MARYTASWVRGFSATGISLACHLRPSDVLSSWPAAPGIPSILRYIAVVDRRVIVISAARTPTSRPVMAQRMTLQIATGGMSRPAPTPSAMPATRTSASNQGSQLYSSFVKRKRVLICEKKPGRFSGEVLRAIRTAYRRRRDLSSPSRAGERVPHGWLTGIPWRVPGASR